MGYYCNFPFFIPGRVVEVNIPCNGTLLTKGFSHSQLYFHRFCYIVVDLVLNSLSQFCENEITLGIRQLLDLYCVLRKSYSSENVNTPCVTHDTEEV